MSVLAVVEIERDQNGELPYDLLRLAYRASRRGRIVLVLNGVSPGEVDRAIDPLVPTMPLNIPGLVYVDKRDAGMLAENSAKANMIFVSPQTAHFWYLAFRLRRTTVRSPQRASEVFGRIAQPARLSEMTASACAGQS